MANVKQDSNSEFAAMLAEFEREQKAPRREQPAVGAEVRGRVVSISRDSVFLDLGGKADGVLSVDEVRDADGQLTVKVGDEVVARVVEVGGKAGGVVLRRMLGRAGSGPGQDVRTALRQAFELGIPVEGQVSAVVKGGVEVQVSGSRAFCPISQLDMRHVEDATTYVGQRLQFRITRFEESRGLNLVLSRRMVLEAEAQTKAEELRKRLEVGVVLRGRVTAIKDYGAFVDLGGIEGMLHVSELSFQRARHPKDILSVGQDLEVQVIKLEKSDDKRRPEKISLSLKSLEKDPFEDIEARFPVGTTLSGKVMRVETFGAFVELEPGIEGLVHIGELGRGRNLRHAREAVKVDQQLTVSIQQLDKERRRISLTLVDADGDTDMDGDAGTTAAFPGGSRGGSGGGNRGGSGRPAAASAPAKFGTLGDLLMQAAKKKS